MTSVMQVFVYSKYGVLAFVLTLLWRRQFSWITLHVSSSLVCQFPSEYQLEVTGMTRSGESPREKRASTTGLLLLTRAPNNSWNQTLYLYTPRKTWNQILCLPLKRKSHITRPSRRSRVWRNKFSWVIFRVSCTFTCQFLSVAQLTKTSTTDRVFLWYRS